MLKAISNLVTGQDISVKSITASNSVALQGLFYGWSPTGTANVANGGFAVGSNSAYNFVISYSATGANPGMGYLDSTFNDTSAAVRIRTRTTGTPVNNLTAWGTGDVDIDTADLVIKTAAKGIVLTNAAGTLTKRARLNDTGDGLIFENP